MREREKQDKGMKILFKEIIEENIPNLRENVHILVQDSQSSPIRSNPNLSALRHNQIIKDQRQRDLQKSE